MSVELTARFFRSIDGDRQYTAADWADYFDTLFKHGVFAEQLEAFEVVGDGSELKVQVKPGRVFMNGYLGILDTEQTLDIDSQATGADRIDRIILKLDSSEDAGGRNIELYVKKGDAAENPSPPSLERAGNIYEFSLAQVLIEGGEGFIPADRPVDERDDENLCGYVRYVAKPAWYPGGEVPLDAWMYVHFPDELTAQEKEDIENDSSLMEIIDEASLIKHIGSRGTVEHDVATISEAGFMSPEDKEALQKMKSLDYQEFTSSGTWSKPEEARFVMVSMFGGGGGGGSGAWDGWGDRITGGAGGGGGALYEGIFPASFFPDSVEVEVGAGGSGGSASSYGGSGEDASNGGDSKFDILTAWGGGGGSGGRRHGSSWSTAASGSGGYSEETGIIWTGRDGGAGGSGSNEGTSSNRSGPGGGSGGSSRENTWSSGGSGGGCIYSGLGTTTGGSPEGDNEEPAEDGEHGQDAPEGSLGAGSAGAGGGGARNVQPGAGGNGGFPAASGGGSGGKTESGDGPPPGGDGAKGVVRIWALS